MPESACLLTAVICDADWLCLLLWGLPAPQHET
jgi:hypothetical protein